MADKVVKGYYQNGDFHQYGKLYGSTGTGTDGAMTQKAVTDAANDAKYFAPTTVKTISGINIAQANGYISLNSSKYGWYQKGSSSIPYYGGFIPMDEYRGGNIRIVKGTNLLRYAFTKSAPTAATSASILCDNCTVKDSNDGYVIETVPNDANYLYVYVSGAGTDFRPERVDILNYISTTDLTKQVQYNTEDTEESIKWVDHGYDVSNSNGYINSSSLKWVTSDTYKAKVIPVSEFAGKRIRITPRLTGLNVRFAFLSAEPTYVNGSAVSYCDGWGSLVSGNYDGYVPEDCAFLYVFAYQSGSEPEDRTPFVETHVSLAKENCEEVFTPTSKIDLSGLSDRLCSIGRQTFYYATSSGVGQYAQRHIALQVTPGNVMRVRSIDKIGQIAVATSAYDPTHNYANGDAIPFATGWESRLVSSEEVITIPSDGAYLLMTTVDGGGMRTRYEVELGTVVENVPSKELSSATPVKLRVVQWNVGGFAKGTAGDDRGYDGNPELFAHDLPIWKETINDMDADIICCCEYNETMIHGTGGSPDVIARDEIFGLLKYSYIWPKYGDYNQKATFSHFRAEESTWVAFATACNTNWYYEWSRFRINNKDVYVIATHLDWNRVLHGVDGEVARQAQMEELMTFAAGKDYVIICADFNCGAGTDEAKRIAGAQEFDQWLDAGWKMANHGYLGDFNTGTRNYSVLDNIIAKGFDVSAIKIYDGDNAKNVDEEQEHQLSDHAAIGCTLTMLL